MKIRNNRFTAFTFATLMGCAFPIFSAAPPPNAIISLQGVPSEIESALRTHVQGLLEQTEPESDNVFLAQLTQHLKQEIILALQPYGYYNPTVNVELSFSDKKWKTSINIALGSPVLVDTIHFTLSGPGQQNTALHDLIRFFTLKTGDVFNHDQYEQGKKNLLTPAIEAGYLSAQFIEHRVEVNIDENKATLFLNLNTGEEHYFGSVTYQKTVLSSHFLDRYLSFQPGDIYSPEKTLSLQSKLSTSDYFSKVEVKPNLEEGQTQVPILVEVEDAKPNQYILGLGYGTDTGVRGKAGWLRRRVNTYGHRFLAEVRLAEIYQKAEVDYIIPGKHPDTDYFKIQGGYYVDQFNDQPSRIYEAGLLQTRELGQWQRRILLAYLEETYPAFITYDRVSARYILPSITFTQYKRDNEAAPTRGRKIEINLQGSADLLVSNTSFLQAYIQTKWLHPYSDTLKLLARFELGATLPDNVEEIPLSQRFYTGGDTTLRGYAYRSLPLLIDQNGVSHPAGGTYLAVGSLEIVKTIKKPFGISAFIDAGNAFRDFGNEIAAGPGVGMEYNTPFGPLKFAVAKPLTKNAASYRIHIMFGPEL